MCVKNRRGDLHVLYGHAIVEDEAVWLSNDNIVVLFEELYIGVITTA